MAEGLLRARCGDAYDAYSAGAVRTGVNADAIRVMREIGIDISAQRSEAIGAYRTHALDYVVTLCDHAREVISPLPTHKKHIHRNFYDPGTHPGTKEEMLSAFRRVRDELDRWIRMTFEEEPQGGGAGLSAGLPRG